MTLEHNRELFLAINPQVFGALPRAWHSAVAAQSAHLDPGYWSRLAALAEEATLDAIFTGDSSALADVALGPADGFDRFAAWSAVLSATNDIGVIATISTTYNDPVQIAERLLTLDVLSGGRVAWNVVTSFSGRAARNFGIPAEAPRDDRYRRAEEFVEVVTGLWRASETGEDFRFEGTHYSVAGRLALPPSPQGRPAIIRASTSDAGRALAGRFADGVFASETTVAGAIEDRLRIRDDAVAAGRAAHDLSLFPGIRTTLASTEEEARAKVQALYEGDDSAFEKELNWLTGLIGTDARELDLDRPIPSEFLDPFSGDRSAYSGSEGFRRSGLAVLRDQPTLTVREYLVQARFIGTGHGAFVGTPEGLADRIETWFRAGAADGFILLPDVADEGFEIVAREVVPLLRKRGIFRHGYDQRTFRGRLQAIRTGAAR